MNNGGSKIFFPKRSLRNLNQTKFNKNRTLLYQVIGTKRKKKIQANTKFFTISFNDFSYFDNLL